MWRTVKISDVCTIKGRIGYRGYTKADLVEPGEGAISLSASNIISNKINFTKSTYISWEKYYESPEIMLEIDDIVFCKTASIGKLAIVEDLPVETTLNPQFVVLKNISCDNRFLYYAIQSPSFSSQISGIIGGTAIPTLSQKNLGELVISLPPISEQQRIVAKLDAAFAEIDETLSLTQSKIDELEKLITSCLKELGNINDAEEFTINTLCKELYAGGDAPSKDKRSLTRTDRFKIPIFSNGSENAGLYGYCEEARTVEPAITISARGTIGHIELRHEPFLPIVRLIVAIPNTDIVQIKFLKYALLGSKIFSSGSSIPQLTVPMLRELPLRIPNLPTQKEIISKLDMIFELREKFQSIQNKKLVQLSALKSAFLAQELQSEAA